VGTVVEIPTALYVAGLKVRDSTASRFVAIRIGEYLSKMARLMCPISGIMVDSGFSQLNCGAMPQIVNVPFHMRSLRWPSAFLTTAVPC